MLRTALCLWIILAASPRAQDTMSAAEFDAYTRGKTLYYGQAGTPYGAEQYLPNRRVRWSFLDGICSEGHWFEEKGHICFVYDKEPAPQCWSFFDQPGGLVARFEGTPPSADLYEVQISDTQMHCLGPRIGV